MMAHKGFELHGTFWAVFTVSFLSQSSTHLQSLTFSLFCLSQQVPFFLRSWMSTFV